METLPRWLAPLVLALATTSLLGGLPAGAAEATPSAVTATRRLIDVQLALEPGGTVVGNTVRYADHVFVAVPAGTFSLSQCSSGQFCLWTSTSYSGSFTYKTGQDVTRAIQTTVGSFYNHRANAARLYSNTGASSVCYGPQVMQASVSASYTFAEKVYLSDTTSC